MGKERQHLIHFHGSTVEGLEKAISEGATIELGEIVVVTGENDDKEE